MAVAGSLQGVHATILCTPYLRPEAMLVREPHDAQLVAAVDEAFSAAAIDAKCDSLHTASCARCSMCAHFEQRIADAARDERNVYASILQAAPAGQQLTAGGPDGCMQLDLGGLAIDHQLPLVYRCHGTMR